MMYRPHPVIENQIHICIEIIRRLEIEEKKKLRATIHIDRPPIRNVYKREPMKKDWGAM